MQALIKEFWNEEDGLQTIEIVLIIAVVIALVTIFKGKVEEVLNSAFGKVDDSLDALSTTP
jgi:Flp pilus assembly pilin Flp